MRGYGPITPDGLALLLGATLVAIGTGVALLRARRGAWMRALAWTVVGATLVLAAVLTRNEPGGNRMLLVCGALFLSMKVVVTAEARLGGRRSPGLTRWLGFALLWPGMRPWPFAETRPAARRGARSLLAKGLAVTSLGLLLIAAARAMPEDAWSRRAALVLAIVALGLVFHFGLFRVAAGAWKGMGVPVGPLFDAPQRSRSLAEFWSRRWNLAFSEMVQVGVQRPLRRRFGPKVATGAAFLFSGLLHEVAISLPARGGYGLPFLYFALHGLLVTREPADGWGAPVTLAAVLLPLPLVFHAPFLDACVAPLLE